MPDVHVKINYDELLGRAGVMLQENAQSWGGKLDTRRMKTGASRAGCALGQDVGGKEGKEKNSWYHLAEETLALEMPDEESTLLLREM